VENREKKEGIIYKKIKKKIVAIFIKKK